MTPQEILKQAANLIERDGWTRKTFYDYRDGCHCAVGAMNRVVSGTPYFDSHSSAVEVFEAVDLLARHLGAYQAESASPDDVVFGWNDDPERTAEEVVATMRAAGLIGI